MKLSTLSAVPVFFGLLLGGAGVAAAADYNMTGTFSWRTNGPTYTIAEGQNIFVGAYAGPFLPNVGVNGPIQETVWLCPAMFEVGVLAQGHCVVSDLDGDEIYTRWNCPAVGPEDVLPGAMIGCRGTYEWTGGTGKFDGITGGGTFSGGTMAILEDGTAIGYTIFDEGAYTIPD